MKKTFLAIIVSITVIAILLGTKPAPYETIKESIESIKTSSFDLTTDIASITLSYFAISDFTRNADGIEVEFYYRTDIAGNLTGESGLIYRAWVEPDQSLYPGYVDYIREETIMITPEGWKGFDSFSVGYHEMFKACSQAIAPVSDLIHFDRNEGEEWGFFERIFNSIHLGIIIIKTIISAVVVSLVDTVGLVWDFASAFFRIVGVAP